jgi:hypothetical protein
MKIRSTFLSFASLLLVGSLASAGPISTPAGPASVDLAAIFSAPVSPDCAKAEPSSGPTPMDMAAVLCGSCSDSPCVGQPIGTFCKVQNGQTYTCQRAFVICTFRDCECWTGPLP